MKFQALKLTQQETFISYQAIFEIHNQIFTDQVIMIRLIWDYAWFDKNYVYFVHDIYHAVFFHDCNRRTMLVVSWLLLKKRHFLQPVSNWLLEQQKVEKWFFTYSHVAKLKQVFH